MKSRIRHVISQGYQYDCLMFVCPGCFTFDSYHSGLHMLPVNSEVKKPSWTWDGNLDAPTISPSILTNSKHPTRRCHSFLVAGVFQFLHDCAHDLAGRHIEMPDLPAWAEELT